MFPIKKMGVFLKSHYQLLIGILILVLAFLISRLPYFLYAPIVGFHNDTADYFMPVDAIYNGHLPKFGLIPPIYPLFLYIIGKLSNNILSIVIIQNLISFLVSLFFVIVVYKTRKSNTIAISIAMFIFFMSSHSIAFDSMLLTESIFASSLILISAFCLYCLYSKNKIIWILFSIALSIPLLIRPNGLIILGLLVIFLAYMIFLKFRRKYFFYLLAPFSIIIVLVLIYNICTLSSPLPDRLRNYIPFISKTDNYELYKKNYQGAGVILDKESYTQKFDSTYGFIKDEARRHIESGQYKVYTGVHLKFLIFFNAISYEVRPFYTSELSKRYNDIYLSNYVKEINWNELTVASMTENFKKIMFKNYYFNLPDYNFQNSSNIINHDSKINNSFFYNIYSFYHDYIIKYIVRTKLILFLFFISFIFTVITYFKSKYKDKLAFFILLQFYLIIATALFYTITGFNTASWRYVYPTEYIYYTCIAFLSTFINIKSILKVKKKKRKHNFSKFAKSL